MQGPLIIEAALNGGTPKERNRHVPRTVDEVVASAMACAGMGATIVHSHTDDPNFGGPARHRSADLIEAWGAVREHHPGVLFYPTVFAEGGKNTIEERYAHVDEIRQAGLLGLAPLEAGTMNAIGLVGGASQEFERDDLVYRFTLAEVKFQADYGRRHRLPASVSIYEPGWLRLVARMHRGSELPEGAMVKLYFGGEDLLFGLPPSEQSLDACLAVLDGTGLPWLVAVQGGDVAGLGLAEAAIKRGGHVRVGLEDYRGPREPANEELVAEVVDMAREADRPVATTDDAARILNQR